MLVGVAAPTNMTVHVGDERSFVNVSFPREVSSPLEGKRNVARINIEDSLFKDNRFCELMVLCGGLETALGAVVRSWCVAQDYWKKDRSLVPFEVWKAQRLNEHLLTVGLAEKREHGIYIAGSEEQFDWLIKRQEAGKLGGKASYAARTRDFNNLRSSNPSAPLEQIEPSSSFSSSFSKPNTENNSLNSSNHWLADLWNQTVVSLPKVSARGRKRHSKILEAVKRRPKEEWETIFKNVEGSDFLTGRDGKWTNCGFDWILNEANATKVFEGNYRNKGKKHFSHQRENEGFAAAAEEAWGMLKGAIDD